VPYQSVNPLNEEVMRTFEQHTDQQMEGMLATADKTFHEIWSGKPVRERAKVIGKAASLMLDQKEKFAHLATLEMGKRIGESRGEVDLSASIPKYFRWEILGAATEARMFVRRESWEGRSLRAQVEEIQNASRPSWNCPPGQSGETQLYSKRDSVVMNS